MKQDFGNEQLFLMAKIIFNSLSHSHDAAISEMIPDFV
jgi:hypothetical protein